MPPSLVLGLALAFAGSLALNTSYVIQHVGAAGAPEVTLRRPLASFLGLLRSRLWLVGGIAGIAGWLLHVGALSHAPLSLAQAFSAGGLALAVPLAARMTGRRLDLRTRRATLLMAGGLAALVVGAPAAHRGLASSLPSVLVFVAGVGAAVAAVATARRGPRALGLVAGGLYGVGDVATKAATSAAHGGWPVTGLLPWAGLLAVTSVLGFFAFQRGLQLGAAVAVVALMTATTNVVAIAGGVIGFGETLGASPALCALHLLGLAGIVVAGWRLAPAQARLTAAA